MLKEQPAPILWDSGYWYVVLAAINSRGHRVPSSAPPRWCATYGSVDGVDYALIRTPDLWLTAPEVNVTVDDVLQAARSDGFHPAGLMEKPGMRVNGK